MATRPDTAPLMARMLPGNLSSRLTLAVLLAVLSVLLIGIAAYHVTSTLSRPARATEDAEPILVVLADHLDGEVSRLDAALVVLADSARMYGLDDMSPESDFALPAHFIDIVRRTGALALVVIDADGSVAAASGDPEAIEDLARTFANLEGPQATASGLAWLDGRVAAVGLQPIVESSTARPVGVLALAAPIFFDDLDAFGHVEIVPPGSAPEPGMTPIHNRAFDRTGVRPGPEGFLLRVDLPGIDGGFAGAVFVDAPYGAGPFAASPGGMLVVALIVAVSVSMLVGLLLARAIGSPIDTLSEHMRAQADAAVEERPLAYVPVDPNLPSEFRALTESFNSMLERFEEHGERVGSAMREAIEARASLEAVFNQSLEGKILLHDARIQLINPSAIAHLALRTDRLLDIPFTEAVAHATFVDERERPLTAENILSRAGNSALIVGLSTPGRSQRWLKITSAAHGSLGGMRLLGTHDVTEELRVDSLRTEIVSLVSHDLRAPLTVITGYLDTLGRNPDPMGRARAIESAKRSALRMQDLLEDLLSATRAEEMFAPAEMVPVDLSGLACDVCSSLSHTSRHIITCDAPPAATVLGEERRLRQVLVNLVSNAQKYAPADTLVTVSIACADGAVVVAVEDEGPGVVDEDRDVIFERFTRLPSDGARRPGVGLGLYIVRAIVEAHGGGVHVERGDRAGGARFVVVLPAPMGGEH